MGAKNYTPYQTAYGPMAADNEANALDVGSIFITSGGTAESATIPAGARLVRIQGNADFWYNFNATAVIPTADDVSGSAIFLPAGERRYVHFNGDGDTLSAISASTGAIFNMVFWT